MSFFPEYLNQGSKGPAVALLQIILLALNCNSRIIPDGDYTVNGETARGVAELQRRMCFKVSDMDGNFGPKTRKAFHEKYGWDVNSLPKNIFQGETQTANS